MGTNVQMFTRDQEVVFARGGGSKVLGVIVYVLAGVVVGGIASLFIAVVALALVSRYTSFSKQTTNVIGCGIGLLGWLAILQWMIKDFLRKLRAEIRVSPRGIETFLMGRKINYPINEIDGVRLVRAATRIVIDLKSGQKFVVPTDLVRPVDLIPHLHRLLLPALAQRLEAALDGGNQIVIKDLGTRATLVALANLGRVLLALLSILTIHGIGSGFRLLRLVYLDLRFCARARNGGLVMDRSGISSLDSTNRLLWDDLIQAAFDSAGMAFSFRNGEKLVISPYARHYCDLWALLPKRGIQIAGADW